MYMTTPTSIHILMLVYDLVWNTELIKAPCMILGAVLSIRIAHLPSGNVSRNLREFETPMFCSTAKSKIFPIGKKHCI